MKKPIAFVLASAIAIGGLSVFTACSKTDYVLNVCNWAEYIDEGGRDGYVYETTGEQSKSVYREFETWFEQQTGQTVRVNYTTFETNEDLYNKMKLGDAYDLVCPSEYMIMKLAAEDLIETYSEEFFDPSVSTNYYIQNLSPYIKNVFDSNEINGTPWSSYAAGYMWGTTGLVYNPEKASAADMTSWSILSNPKYKNSITTKDNARDSYFAGLAIYYEDEILTLNSYLADGTITESEYKQQLSELMNDTQDSTITAVEQILKDMKSNLYGLETDTGKEDMITGKISVNFAWSGDAVYAMDQAEENGMILEYAVPETCANLWFDGWVIPKNRTADADIEGGLTQKQIAEMFVNYLSMPQNAIRNMYYIGYTSVLASDEIFDYVTDTYGVAEGETGVDYDLSYFFGEGHSVETYEDQLNRQLFAQYPTQAVMTRCAVMNYFPTTVNDKINNMWTNVKG